MGAIDDYSVFVQSANKVLAEAAKTAINLRLTAMSDVVLPVVCQLHHAQTKCLIGLDEVEISSKRLSTLEAVYNSDLTTAFAASISAASGPASGPA